MSLSTWVSYSPVMAGSILIDKRIAKAGVVLSELYRTVVVRAQLSSQVKLAIFKSLYYPNLKRSLKLGADRQNAMPCTSG